MNNSWVVLIDFAWVALFIVIANSLKSRLKWLRNFFVPTAIVAGIIGLLLGGEVLGLISLDSQRLGNMVYHLMAVGFIALALKDDETKKTPHGFNSGLFIVSTYLVQGIIGFSVTLLLIKFAFPSLFPTFGLLLPLGYGQGPGQAFSIGSQWENIGFVGGGNVGLTVATLGFLWAIVIGVVFMNVLMRKGVKRRDDNIHRLRKAPEIITNTVDVPPNESIDSLSVQFCLIGLVYLATYLTLLGINKLMVPFGTFGETLNNLLWGFHFVIGTVYAILLRTILRRLKAGKFITNSRPNNYLLQRIAGFSFDFMITASIAAISLFALKDYVVPILIVTTIGGLVTILYVTVVGKMIFKQYTLENILGFYGNLTGTISTGMALLKEVDPNFDTDVPENIVVGSAIALPFGFPLMVVLNIPVFGVVTGRPIMYLYTMLAFIGYLLFLWALMYVVHRRQYSKSAKSIDKAKVS